MLTDLTFEVAANSVDLAVGVPLHRAGQVADGGEGFLDVFAVDDGLVPIELLRLREEPDLCLAAAVPGFHLDREAFDVAFDLGELVLDFEEGGLVHSHASSSTTSAMRSTSSGLWRITSATSAATFTALSSGRRAVNATRRMFGK